MSPNQFEFALGVPRKRTREIKRFSKGERKARPRLIVFFHSCGLLFFLFPLILGCNNYFFYFPTSKTYVPPERLNLSYKEFYLSGADQNSIHAWLFPPSAKAVATVIQFHGNAQNISSHYLSLLWLLEHNFELFTFDYRGYGRSEGSANTGKIIADSKLVLGFLQNRNQKTKRPIIVYGQSLGGILAARTLGEMEKRDLIRAIVIEASFSSYRSIGKQVAAKSCLPLGYLAYMILSDRYAIQEILPQLSPIHTIVVHGKADPIVPYANGPKMFVLAKEPKDFLEIPGGKHLDWHLRKNYGLQRRILVKMMKSAL